MAYGDARRRIRWRRRAAPATGFRGGNQASTTPACTTNLLNAACAGPRRPLDPFLAAFVKWLRRGDRPRAAFRPWWLGKLWGGACLGGLAELHIQWEVAPKPVGLSARTDNGEAARRPDVTSRAAIMDLLMPGPSHPQNVAVAMFVCGFQFRMIETRGLCISDRAHDQSRSYPGGVKTTRARSQC